MKTIRRKALLSLAIGLSISASLVTAPAVSFTEPGSAYLDKIILSARLSEKYTVGEELSQPFVQLCSSADGSRFGEKLQLKMRKTELEQNAEDYSNAESGRLIYSRTLESSDSKVMYVCKILQHNTAGEEKYQEWLAKAKREPLDLTMEEIEGDDEIDLPDLTFGAGRRLLGKLGEDGGVLETIVLGAKEENAILVSLVYKVEDYRVVLVCARESQEGDAKSVAGRCARDLISWAR